MATQQSNLRMGAMVVSRRQKKAAIAADRESVVFIRWGCVGLTDNRSRSFCL
jgi:hypothetical protein